MGFPSLASILNNIEHNRYTPKRNAMDPQLTALIEPAICRLWVNRAWPESD